MQNFVILLHIQLLPFIFYENSLLKLLATFHYYTRFAGFKPVDLPFYNPT